MLSSTVDSESEQDFGAIEMECAASKEDPIVVSDHSSDKPGSLASASCTTTKRCKIFTTSVIFALVVACLLYFFLDEPQADAELEIPFDISAYDKKNVLSFQLESDAVAYVRMDDEKIYVAMAAEGNFVAFGFNPDSHGSMEGSDIVVCAEYEGELQAKEYDGLGEFHPELDTKQDWNQIRIGRLGKLTYCEVARPLISECDLPVFDSTTVYSMLLAWGSSSSNTGLHYHGRNRASLLMSFERFAKSDAGTNSDSVITIVAPTVEMIDLPGFETCSWHVLPIDPDTGFHIVNVEYILNMKEGGAAQRTMSHHSTLVAYNHIPEGWVDGELIPAPAGADPINNCADMWMASGGDLVPQVINIGGDEGVYFGAGRAIGVVLLRHFYNNQNNPNHLTGALDQDTTWRLTYTDQLRPKTLSKLIVQTTDIGIPANARNYRQQVLCPGESLLEQAGRLLIKALSIHAHDRESDTLAVYVRHIRNGTELTPLLIDEDYVEGTGDEAVKNIYRYIEPGDDILLECIYDNPTDQIVNWGAGINDQMCVAIFDIVTETDESAFAASLDCLSHSDPLSFTLRDLYLTMSPQEYAEKMDFLPYNLTSQCSS